MSQPPRPAQIYSSMLPLKRSFPMRLTAMNVPLQPTWSPTVMKCLPGIYHHLLSPPPTVQPRSRAVDTPERHVPAVLTNTNGISFYSQMLGVIADAIRSDISPDLRNMAMAGEVSNVISGNIAGKVRSSSILFERFLLPSL